MVRLVRYLTSFLRFFRSYWILRVFVPCTFSLVLLATNSPHAYAGVVAAFPLRARPVYEPSSCARELLAEVNEGPPVRNIGGDPFLDGPERTNIVMMGDRFVPIEKEQTIADRVSAGLPVDFDALDIPSEARRFYDPQTGRFNYVNSSPLRLARENGDAKLKAIRINFANHNDLQLHKYPEFDNHEAFNRAIFRDYANVLSIIPDLELWVVASAADRGLLDSLLGSVSPEIRQRIRLVPHGDTTVLYEWAQDGSKPAADGRSTIVPANRRSGSQGSAYSAANESLSAAGLVDLKRSMFDFQGGDVIPGARHNFMGTNIVKKLMKTFHVSRAEALSALKQEFGQDPVEIGVPSLSDEFMPVALHIDLAMAVARNHKNGEEVILLDSSNAAMRGLESRYSSGCFAADCHIQFIQRLIENIDIGLLQQGINSWTDREMQLVRLLWLINPSREHLVSAYGNYVRNLVIKLNYDVVYLPGISNLATRQDFNYTNAILSGRFAIVPQMNVRALDEAAFAVYRSLGYTVIPMPSAALYFLLNGGTRCASETHRYPECEI